MTEVYFIFKNTSVRSQAVEAGFPILSKYKIIPQENYYNIIFGGKYDEGPGHLWIKNIYQNKLIGNEEDALIGDRYKIKKDQINIRKIKIMNQE